MVGFEVWDPESSYVPWRKLTETYIGAILGLYRDNGKENGNYYSIIGIYWDYTGLLVEHCWYRARHRERGCAGELSVKAWLHLGHWQWLLRRGP